LVSNPDIPFILYKRSRDWIANIYPYTPYIVAIVKNIEWNSFRYTGDGYEFVLGLNKKGIAPYVFFGGCNLEFYDKIYSDVEKLHNYVPPTADIDIGVYGIIVINKEAYKKDKRIEEIFVLEFHEFIKKELEKMVGIFKTLLGNNNVEIELRIDRIKINFSLTIDGEIYKDHICDFVFLINYSIDEKLYKLDYTFAELNFTFTELSEIDVFRLKSINILSSETTYGYNLRNLFYEALRNSEIVCSRWNCGGRLSEAFLNADTDKFDKLYSRLKRLEYSLKLLIKLLVKYDVNDKLIIFLNSDANMKKYIIDKLTTIFKVYEYFKMKLSKSKIVILFKIADLKNYIISYINVNKENYDSNYDEKYSPEIKALFDVIIKDDNYPE